MFQALKQLGFHCQQDEAKKTIQIKGEGGHIPNKSVSIHVGNAGTAARFLTAFLALEAGGQYHLDGDPAMRIRPMSGLLDIFALDAAAFEFHGEVGYFPFTLKAKGYRGSACSVDASASSRLIALLLAAPAGKSSLELASPRRTSAMSQSHKEFAKALALQI